jgi:uncharacterized membrane protein YtjA (UPF0391 family)
VSGLLTWAIVFLIIAIIAYLLGARGFAWFSADIAKFLVWIFIILFVIFLVLSFIRGSPATPTP